MLRTRVPHRVLALRALIAVATAVCFAIFEQMADVYLARHGLTRADILIDDVVGAVLLGILVFLWVMVVDEHHRRVQAEERQVLTAEMNHHIRNALTVIKYAAYSENQAERVQMIDESVERIDATLHQLLPTLPKEVSSEQQELSPPARKVI